MYGIHQDWAGAPNCRLDLIDKLQKQICTHIGPSLAVSFKPFSHCRNEASLSLFFIHYFRRCSSELAQLVPLLFSRGRSTRYSDRLHDFSVTISRCYKDVYVNRFFPRTARLWNSMPIECFPLTYDLSGFKSRINCRFFLNRFTVCCNLFVLLFLVTPCLIVTVQSCMERIPIKKKISALSKL